MTNVFYTASGTPATGATGASAPMRTEFTAVQTAFDKLPALTASTAIVVNAGGTALTNTVGTLALAGNFATTGAFSTTLIAGANVSLTLPVVSGTLATLAGTEALTNKTITAPVLSGSVTGTYTLAGTPTITGAAITTSTYNGMTVTASTGTFTLTNGKTFAVSAGLALTGTDSTTMTFPSTSATIARTDAANTFSGTQTVRSGSTSVIGKVAIGRVSDEVSIGVAGNNGDFFGVSTRGDCCINSASSLILGAGGTEGIIIDTSGNLSLQTVGTTASAANMFISGAAGAIQRSTSSVRYKNQISDLNADSGALVDALKPIRFHSLGKADDPAKTHYGLLAEDTAKADPSLANWIAVTEIDRDAKPPEGYASWPQYITANAVDGMVPDAVPGSTPLTAILIAEVKSLRARLAAAGIP